MDIDVKRPGLLLLSVSLLSCSMLLFEISLTKIFSVTLWYHFAYFVVSLSLFGIGAGGILSFVLQDRLSGEGMARLLARGGYLQGLVILVCLLIILNFDLTTGSGSLLSKAMKMVVLYPVCSLPFLVFGFIISLLIRNYSEVVSRIYSFDLAGSALGCLLFLYLISRVSGPAVVLFSAGAGVAASFMFRAAGPGLFSRRTVAIILALGLLVIVVHEKTDVFTIKYTKKFREREDILFEKWSPLARITVYPNFWMKNSPTRPFSWGLSSTYRPDGPVEQAMWIEQDASAGTPITRFDGDLEKVAFLKYDITSFPYHVKPAKNAFIIGSGGGRDVLTAYSFGVENIHACEINPVIVDLVGNRYRDFSGNIYNLNEVQMEIGDARNVIRRSSQRYDLIQMSLIDSWAATTAGAFSLTENSLYTVEAFRDYIEHLTPEGILGITRFLFKPRNQTLRTAIVARSALESMGIDNVRNKIAVVSTGTGNGTATLLIKKTPFREEELSAIENTAKNLRFPLLYIPDAKSGANDKIFEAALNAEKLSDFTDRYYYDVRPTTDDRPFFFQMVYFTKVLDLLDAKKISGQKFNYYATAVIILVFTFAFILTVLFFFVPLKLSGKYERIPFKWGVYFLLIGMGFMFVEIPMLQKGAIFLGHPTYSFSVALFSILLFGSLGSYLSARLKSGSVKPFILLLAVIAIILVIVTVVTELIMPSALGWSFGARVALMIAVLAAMAVPMGGAFPLGLSHLADYRTHAIPWAWAINGAASVLGSVIAMAVAMSQGYRFALMLGPLCYALAACTLWLGGKSNEVLADSQ